MPGMTPKNMLKVIRGGRDHLFTMGEVRRARQRFIALPMAMRDNIPRKLTLVTRRGMRHVFTPSEVKMARRRYLRMK